MLACSFIALSVIGFPWNSCHLLTLFFFPCSFHVQPYYSPTSIPLLWPSIIPLSFNTSPLLPPLLFYPLVSLNLYHAVTPLNLLLSPLNPHPSHMSALLFPVHHLFIFAFALHISFSSFHPFHPSISNCTCPPSTTLCLSLFLFSIFLHFYYPFITYFSLIFHFSSSSFSSFPTPFPTSVCL